MYTVNDIHVAMLVYFETLCTVPLNSIPLAVILKINTYNGVTINTIFKILHYENTPM